MKQQTEGQRVQSSKEGSRAITHIHHQKTDFLGLLGRTLSVGLVSIKPGSDQSEFQ